MGQYRSFRPAVIFVFTGKGRQINRWEGALFLTLYITYLTLLIVS